MKHRQIRKELATNIRKLLRKRSFSIVFRDYQRETLESTVRWLERPRASRSAYVSHATGLGKTALFASIVSEAKNLNCLVVVPTKLLVAQTAREIVKLTNHAIGHISSLGKILDAEGEESVAIKGHDGHRIVVTTDQGFKMRAAKFAEDFCPHVIIRDECHWSYTEKSQDATELFTEAVVIGYSATPDYLTTTAKADYIPVTLDNGQTLYAAPGRVAKAYYPELLDRRTVRWGIENEHLAPLAWGLLEFDISLDDVPVTETPLGMDYDPEELREALAHHWPMMEETIIRLYEDNIYNIRTRQVCAVCPGVSEAESLAKKIARFAPSACITGSTKDEDRDAILASFDSDQTNKKTIRFISSVFVLREGWDARNAEIALMLRPTKSRTLYEQFLGRILRLRRDGRKKIALALDMLFLRTKFSPLSAPVLYGVPGEKVVEGGILVGPKRRGRSRKVISSYLPKHIRPKVHVVQALEIEYWVGKDGFMQVDGERWGTIYAFTKLLRLSEVAIKARLSSCRSRDGRGLNGSALTCYALRDVTFACQDLLAKNPKATADGFFKVEGEEWYTRLALTHRLSLSLTGINPRLEFCRKRQGKNTDGRLRVFYAFSDVKKACADLLKEVPKADADGFFTVDNERWGTISAIFKRLPISEDSILARASSYRSREGKSTNGQVLTFYAFSDVKKACADLLKEVPKAGNNGFFKADGEKWYNILALERVLRISRPTLRKYIRSGSCRSREGRLRTGSISDFYALSDVKQSCAELVARKKNK